MKKKDVFLFGWVAEKTGNFVDVKPVNDMKEHINGEDCWCQPSYENGVFTHNAMDCREEYENGKRKMS